MEHHPYAFFLVTGTASVLALVVCIYGMRVLRRVRRVALSGNEKPSLNRLMASRMSEPFASLQYNRDSLSLQDKLVREAVEIQTVLGRRRAAFWDWIFRQKVRRVAPRGAEPVWINKQADAARARDALRSQEYEAEDRAKETRETLKLGWKDPRVLEKAWKEETDCWGPSWESGALKWRSKAKWARE